MIRRSLIAAAAFLAAMALPAIAAAQTLAYASYDGYTNVRAGPSTRYPVVARLAPGTGVDVLGCLQDRAWCQILIDDLQGWVYSRRLEFVYSGRRYLVPDYYAYFGAPLVYFNFDIPRRRYHRDYDKPIFGHPGGGGPGPEYIAPSGGDNPAGGPVVVEGDVYGHPGGGGPGPETLVPMPGMGPGGSMDGGGGGPCQPGDPNCLEGVQ